MESTNRFQALTWRATAAALAVLAVSACSVSEQEAPSLAGPSGFALSLTVSAAPQVLPRDGSSMSTINIVARDANGAGINKQRLRLLPSAGSLNVSEVETDGNGNASVLFTAPGLNEPVSVVVIEVVPVDRGDLANTNVRSVRIGVVGPSLPVANFSYTPPKDPEKDPAPMVGEVVSFISTSTIDGAPCASACSYAWDFDDGSTIESGMSRPHKFAKDGVYNVTLTVTYLAAGTSSSVTKPVIISPLPTAPTAGFTVKPSSPTVGTAATFDASVLSTVGTGATIVQYLWDFGDGGSDTGASPTYTYTAAGQPTVTLTVIDNFGRQATASKTITVQ
jgi:PKD repeat protein